MKKKIFAMLLSIMLLVISFAGKTYATEPVDDTNNGETVEQEVNDTSEEVFIEDLAESDDVTEQPGTEDTNINYRTDEVITAMDINGNVTEVENINGYLENEVAVYSRMATPKIVNFNTRGNAVTEYTEYGTGVSGYTNGMYGADAAYLGEINGKVKFMLSGVIGLVDSSLVQVVDYSLASSVSYYAVSGGRLIHYITTNITQNYYASTLDNGPAPSYLQEGVKYYSYDGHYFYTLDNFGYMLDDYNNEHRDHSVNSVNPYYNYFQYLPLRSETSYTADQLNSIISTTANSSSSKLLNTGSTFIQNQNTYGVNALLAVGVAANESWWGKSYYAINYNNLFGLNAVDADPNQAYMYSSVDQCIKAFAETYMSKQYLNPSYWVYAGGFLGNKGSGMNVKYASDPYWGEKNANVAWMIDKSCGNKDVNKYTLGVKDLIGTEHNTVNVRNGASLSSTVIHTTKSYSNQSFIILDTTQNNGFYKIQSDGALNSARTAISSSGAYDFTNMYAYISAGYVDIISKAKATTVSVEYEAHVQDVGWQGSVSDGEVAGTVGQNKKIEALAIAIKNDSNLGVSYTAYIEGSGWSSSRTDGIIVGTTGENKRLEAIKINLTGTNASKYNIYYRVHVEDYGWLGWAKDGEPAGTVGYDKKVEGIQIMLVSAGGEAPGTTDNSYMEKIDTDTTAKPISVSYSAHVENIGWQSFVSDGTTAGTTGSNLQVEALKIQINNSTYTGDVEYSAYVQDIGWQSFVKNGAIAGTTGKNKHVEAIKIQLTDQLQEAYDIYYRVHASDFGWMGWAKNGDPAGSEGYEKQVEAIEVMLVGKGDSAPGSTSNAFVSKSTSTTVPEVTVKYAAHVENIGWQSFVTDGATAGTTGKNLQIEALKIFADNKAFSGNIEYSAHVEDIGWQSFVTENTISGTTGNNKAVEAVKIKLTDEMSNYYDIYYRVHASEFGWLGWAKNGDPAGSEGYARHIEAIQIKIVKKGAAAPGSTSDSFYKK